MSKFQQYLNETKDTENIYEAKSDNFVVGNDEKDLSGEEYYKCPTRASFDKAAYVMGWKDGAEFEEDTDTPFEELKGRFFSVMQNSVYIAGHRIYVDKEATAERNKEGFSFIEFSQAPGRG